MDRVEGGWGAHHGSWCRVCIGLFNFQADILWAHGAISAKKRPELQAVQQSYPLLFPSQVTAGTMIW